MPQSESILWPAPRCSQLSSVGIYNSSPTKLFECYQHIFPLAHESVTYEERSNLFHEFHPLLLKAAGFGCIKTCAIKPRGRSIPWADKFVCLLLLFLNTNYFESSIMEGSKGALRKACAVFQKIWEYGEKCMEQPVTLVQ